MLKQELKEELKQSMLAKDTLKTSVLRMLISGIIYYEIQKGTELWHRASSPASEADRRVRAGYEATDEDVLSVIQKEAKQRKDSIEEFKKANRPELVEKETKELAMLQVYLPTQMDENQIREIIQETIREMGATTVADMGKVMGVLMPKVKGKADGTLVSKIVKEELNP
jgi:hypothetical protein